MSEITASLDLVRRKLAISGIAACLEAVALIPSEKSPTSETLMVATWGALFIREEPPPKPEPLDPLNPVFPPNKEKKSLTFPPSQSNQSPSVLTAPAIPSMNPAAPFARSPNAGPKVSIRATFKSATDWPKTPRDSSRSAWASLEAIIASLFS